MAGLIARRVVFSLFHRMGNEISSSKYAKSVSLFASLTPSSTKAALCVRHPSHFSTHHATTVCNAAITDDSITTADDSTQLPKPTSSSAAEILANLTPEESKRLKVLRLEYDTFNSSGVQVPEFISDDEWVYLLKCTSLSQRKRRYIYLFKTEKSILNARAKAAENRRRQDEKRAYYEELKKDGKYEFKNTFMLFLQEQTMNRTYKNNLCYAMMNGPHLVFDFAFEQTMSDQELTNLISQIQLCHGENKVIREPFHFHFCNIIPGSQTDVKLRRGIPNLDELPLSVTKHHYLDCYPKERLVYLSPNSPNLLQKFEVDDVYVIGAIVDKAVEDPLTLAKAKKEKIRTARFPLDQHVR